MKCIITVLGRDQRGIIAKVCMYLYNNGFNILDISQSVVDGYFNMLMIADLNGADTSFEEMSGTLERIGAEIGVVVKVQHEDIFNTMHTI